MDTKKPAPKEALGEILGNFRKYLYLESTSQNYNGKGSFKTLGEVTEATPRRREGSARPGPAPRSLGTPPPAALRLWQAAKSRSGSRSLTSDPAKISRAYQSAAGTPLSPPPPGPRPPPTWAGRSRAGSQDRAAGSAGTRRAASGPALQAARSPRTPPRGRVAAQPTACSAPALPPGALGGASWGLRAEEEELRGPGGPEESEPAAGVAGAGPPQSPGGLVPGRGGGAHRLLRWQGLQLRRMRVCDDHLLLRLPVLAALGLDLPQDIQTFRDLPEHHVLAIQPIHLVTRQEELGAIGVGARAGHGEQACCQGNNV
ncbi:uncharacterized protein [Canis lupus baileyi]|uniref:uncharacterized protein n=1 Tax=Canis lupus baileyi TaxID=143281 RepID=UPI003B9794FE